MLTAESRRSIVIRSALLTPLCLIGTFFVGALFGSLVFSGLPGHLEAEAKTALAALPALACVVAGGAWWGRTLARTLHLGDVKRMTWAGALGYGPTLILVAIVLPVLENLIVEQQRWPGLPIHVVFT